jgi:hypothetical protein
MQLSACQAALSLFFTSTTPPRIPAETPFFRGQTTISGIIRSSGSTAQGRARGGPGGANREILQCVPLLDANVRAMRRSGVQFGGYLPSFSHRTRRRMSSQVGAADYSCRSTREENPEKSAEHSSVRGSAAVFAALVMRQGHLSGLLCFCVRCGVSHFVARLQRGGCALAGIVQARAQFSAPARLPGTGAAPCERGAAES